MLTPYAFAKATTSTAIQCLDAPAAQPVSAWPRLGDQNAVLASQPPTTALSP
jgi:hypothetical protein